MTLTEIAIHGSLYILNYELFGAPTSIVSRLFTFYSALCMTGLQLGFSENSLSPRPSVELYSTSAQHHLI